MITSVNNSDLYLYHYTKVETTIDYILENFTLKIAPYEQTNDPKETKNWQFDIGTNEKRDLRKYNIEDLSRQMNRLLKSNTGVLCFCQDDRNLIGRHIEDVTKRGFMKPRMWAQYADNHRGLCLVFDKMKLLESFALTTAPEPLSIHGPMSYVNRSFLHGSQGYIYTINIDYIENHGIDEFCRVYAHRFYKNLFFEKMTDWSTEDEYRCVVLRDTKDTLFLDIRNSLRGILFGESADPNDVLTIQKIVSPLGIETMGIRWKNACPWYDYENPLYSPALRNWGNVEKDSSHNDGKPPHES